MLDIFLSKELFFLLFIALCVVAALSVPAILMERKSRRKYRRPTEVRQK